jgi:hypothetical protein
MEVVFYTKLAWCFDDDNNNNNNSNNNQALSSKQVGVG